MRNVVAALSRRSRRLSLINFAAHSDYTIVSTLLFEVGHESVEVTRGLPYFLQRNPYSTGFTSVHGEGPSADYAKLRKKVLESEFGHVLGAHQSKTQSLSIFYRSGPFLALYRAAIISFHVVKLAIWQLFVQDMKKRSVKFRETLISLGPFYIKLGQALSTRPDILPTVYCQELAKLQDQIPPFPTHVALKSIELQLGAPVSLIFADISPEPIAAASLGQVYKAHLHSGELVAVKVQRPGMSLKLTLDALLFNMVGGQLKRFAKARKDLLVAVNEMVRHMFDEIDYILEGQNAERFASLYGLYSHDDEPSSNRTSGVKTRPKKNNSVKVPKIYWKYTRKAVLTMEWVDGIKLTDEEKLGKAFLNRKELIDQGLYCSLRQLLEVGFFHADPHPGNLIATKNGYLAYFDFGMMGDIPRHYRVGLIQVIVHFVNRDSLSLANDFLSLGFLAEGVDVLAVSAALEASFGDGTQQSQDFQAIMNQLYDVMYDFNFTLPPDYALVIRALGSLEGTAKALDPDFKVIESAYPFVIGRLLADPNPDMRKILRELVIRNDGSIRWNRLERLVAAISEQSTESAEEDTEAAAPGNMPNPLGWKSFDMRAVVAATEDLFHFILSQKGSRVRVFLLRDILKAVDAFLEDEVEAYDFDEKIESRDPHFSERQAMLKRVSNGFRSLQHAVSLAPNVWMSMFLRLAMKPEVRTFSLDILSATASHVSSKAPHTFWIWVSKLLHKVT
uniref:Protein kinase domain-containing protein n=1 Tax=Kalanchoe fedtschenkoi TaxID=63787 RepID=A0A7N1A709_KALFE